nr:hypothetical protein [uncultured Flavobacterium sp.]
MKKLVLFFLMITACPAFSQISEGQKFCEETKEGPYFPVSLINFNKKVFWYTDFYKETKEEVKIINGITYTQLKQEWNNGKSSLLYYREENGVVLQYDEDMKKETVRYDNSFPEGHIWKAANGKDHFKILSYKGELRTPYCEYKNLLVIDAHVSYGHFNFYYLKGHGYIGATKDGKIVSCISPE